MAYGLPNGHVTDDVTWPWKIKLVTPIRLERNISKTTWARDFKFGKQLWLPGSAYYGLLWGSTVGYPSDSLASCFYCRRDCDVEFLNEWWTNRFKNLWTDSTRACCFATASYDEPHGTSVAAGQYMNSRCSANKIFSSPLVCILWDTTDGISRPEKTASEGICKVNLHSWCWSDSGRFSIWTRCARYVLPRRSVGLDAEYSPIFQFIYSFIHPYLHKSLTLEDQ